MIEQNLTVRQYYEQQLQINGYHSDPAQLKAIDELSRFATQWSEYQQQMANSSAGFLARFKTKPTPPKGVYMYGGVGRGKSFLMECFYNTFQDERKTRLHFHEFMLAVHKELVELQGIVNPLDELGKRIAKRHSVICFDEFHIANITDAMILYRLLDSLFKNNVGFITTSNFMPDELYPNGLHRDRILPAIELLNQKTAVICVDAGTDYRRRDLEILRLYYTPITEQTALELNHAFDELADSADEDTTFEVEKRQLTAKRRAGKVVWFDFATLCETPRSQTDYLNLANQFETIIVSDIPKMLANQASAARRFTWLIDVMYDRRVKLIVSAQVPAEELYTAGSLAHEFVRTVSRINEMQSAEFLALERRIVEERLT